ncbi:hypothetical protein JOC54_001073 [Alkalihalobacillus xiaoxiensis]|uniref:Uncharacterized protein n=1 Tax=Shouchella xiaoxiensis TaxID=766895 RepID=A0ABS2SQS0_9BACI|nr:hypothetical protein [Shouchella xiaoxiensis]MBM7837842.1 hypothetical protein [Shouchella xiaoxiensis]
MNSIDDVRKSGRDGKKSTWHLLFHLPTYREAVAFTIQAGTIVNEIRLENFDGTNQQELKLPHLQFDSTEAIELAIYDFALVEGDGHTVIFSGYHFKAIKENNIPFLTVVGTLNAKMAEIHFNAATGEYLGWTESHS